MASSGGWLKKGYWGFAKAEGFLGHFLLLAIRLYWGYSLVMVGAGKWMNISSVGEHFEKLGIHPSLAYVVASIELLGGISLFFGILTRFFALLVSIVMGTALVMAHWDSITSFKNFIEQEPFLYLYAALVVLCFGPGLFSIDYWLEKKSYGTAI